MNLKSMMPMVVIALIIVTVGSGKLEPYYFILAALCLTVLVIWTARDAQLLPAAAAKALDFKSHKQKVENEGEKAAAKKREEAFRLRTQRISNAGARIREILTNTVFGQDRAIDKVLHHVTNHLVKPNPEKPLVISLMGPAGYRKEEFAKGINDVVSYLNDTVNHSSPKSALEDTSGYGDAIAGASGVFILTNAGNLRQGDLGHVLNGQRKRMDPHLIVVLIEETTVAEINRLASEDDETLETTTLAEAKKKLKNLIDFVHINVFLEPMEVNDMAASLWKSASEAAEREYHIKIHNWGDDQYDGVIEWLARYANAASDGRQDPAIIQKKIVEDLMPALMQARINCWSEVYPVIREVTDEDGVVTRVMDLVGYHTPDARLDGHQYEYQEA
jgi:hypothetical protein